jgi:hypothetical protein
MNTLFGRDINDIKKCMKNKMDDIRTTSFNCAIFMTFMKKYEDKIITSKIFNTLIKTHKYCDYDLLWDFDYECSIKT